MEFSRQPRLMPEYPAGELNIEKPASVGEKPEISWFQMFVAPLVMVCITIFVFLAGQAAGGGIMSNPMILVSSIAMTAVSLVGSLVNLNHQLNKHKHQKKRRDKKYKEYILEKDAELSLAAEQQSHALRQMNPSPGECIDRMNLNPPDPRLWERTPGFDDFLSFRLGIGTAKASLYISKADAPGLMETDPLALEPQKLALKHEKVQNVPVCLDLRAAQICGIAGAEDKTAALVNSILIQITANHGYDNVRIFILSDARTLKEWEWSRLLPHLWNDSLTARRVICSKDAAKLTLDEVYSDIKERDKKGGDAVFSIFYIFIVESPEIIEDAPIRKYIYEPNVKIGVTAVFTAGHAAYLPAHCGAVVTLKGKTGELVDRVKNERNVFVPDTVKPQHLESAARRVAPLRVKSLSTTHSLPSSISLCRMLGEPDLTKVDVLSNWKNRRTFNGMDVPIGVRAGGEPLCLDLHETGHGPHGLVAGTTGSGKSELLQSLIISLAINFHPHDVVFILIDYKGGGMADVFKGMPHLAGVITNLGGGQTARALLSIKSEITRRQSVFAERGVNNIGKYQRLYYSEERPEGMEPVPHLIMIADEFAELQQDQPEFMKQLVSAARVGRSLGIHLILATQKPDGVVDDQIWSNSKFKLCLKVQTESDSNGVLKKPDAAFIREPGRAYVQVGNDEIYELFQSTYSGADYIPDASAPEEKTHSEASIYRLSADGRGAQIYPPPGARRLESDKRNPSQLEVMVGHITAQSHEAGIAPLAGPWTEPLEETVYYNELPGDWRAKRPDTALSAMAGVVDDPRGQRKFPLELDFANDGGLIVYGASGSGKTSLLKTICLSLAERYTPDEVNIYLMDMGGASLKVFDGLPHCGGVLTVDRERDIRQFVRYLFRIVENRKTVFEETGSEGFAEYRKTVSGEAGSEGFAEYRKSGADMPAIVVMIDGYAALSELYEDVDEQLTLFSRDAFRYGVYLVLTCVTTRDVRYKMSTNFKMAVTFELIDKSYSDIVGRTEGVEPESFRGRGLVKLEKPLEFQAALPELRGAAGITRTKDAVREIAENETRMAAPIPIMPDKIDIAKLNGDKAGFLIGLYDSDLTPVPLDFSAFTSLIITGEPGCGKSTVAAAWINMLPDAEIYAMDSNGAGLTGVLGNRNVRDLSGVDDFEAFTEEIVLLLKTRRNELIEARKRGGDAGLTIASWKQIIFVFDKFSEASDNDEYYDFMELVMQIIKREHGMKVAVLALDTLEDFRSDYSDAGKALRNEQTGILLGSIKTQSLFNVGLPYGVPEKELAFGDGYFIKKTRFEGIRAALL